MDMTSGDSIRKTGWYESHPALMQAGIFWSRHCPNMRRKRRNLKDKSDPSSVHLPLKRFNKLERDEAMNKSLIIDVGMHTGRDTEFYLKKGFEVIAIEANPRTYQTRTISFYGCSIE